MFSDSGSGAQQRWKTPLFDFVCIQQKQTDYTGTADVSGKRQQEALLQGGAHCGWVVRVG